MPDQLSHARMGFCVHRGWTLLRSAARVDATTLCMQGTKPPCGMNARSEDTMPHLLEEIARSSSGCVRASHDPRWRKITRHPVERLFTRAQRQEQAPTDPMLRAQTDRGRLRCCVSVSVMFGKPERRGFAFLPVLAVGGTVVNGMRCIAVNSARASRG